MNKTKWTVWKTPFSADYVTAHKAVEGENTVSFIDVLSEGTEKTVATYQLKDIQGYNESK